MPPSLTGFDPVNWPLGNERVQIFKKTVSPDAAQYLVAASEPDMYTLKNEILKICSYVGKGMKLHLDDIKTLATPTIKSVIFDLLDAVPRETSAGFVPVG